MMNLLMCLLLSLSTFASIEISNFNILPGKFHNGGKASAEVLSTDIAKSVMMVKLSYEVYKKPLVPVSESYLKRSVDQEMPLEFQDERGYLNLEKIRTMVVKDGTLIYVGRVDVGEHKNGHHVRIIANNGYTETDIFYHPYLPELGWGKLVILLHPTIPFLKNYTIEALLE